MSLIQNLNISAPIAEEEEVFDYHKIYNKCLVDLSEEIMLPPTALSIGSHEYKGNMYDNNTFSYGEFSAIVAASKSKKTFFKSSLIAGFIGGNTSTYFPQFKSHREGEPVIIDIDTEQGDFYAQRAFRRVADLVGENYNNYLPFGLEELDPEEIVKFIDSLLKDPRHKGKVKWMSIDGIADLLDNANDIEKSFKVAQNLKRWRKENNMHINTVIHKNSTSDKATGHLGSYVQKKSETVILLKDTEEDHKIRNSPIEVSQIYSRGAPFDEFYFKLNDLSLPYECDNNSKEW
jgi:hypothetical protein